MITDLTGFDFDKWQADQDAKRARRVAELTAAFAAGQTVIETLPRGQELAWRVGANTFIEPYKSDPTHLAKHIENREYGFGFTVTICHERPRFVAYVKHDGGLRVYLTSGDTEEATRKKALDAVNPPFADDVTKDWFGLLKSPADRGKSK